MYFNWISTASFITLNKRGVKNVFRNTKLIQHRFIKSFVFQLGRISHSEKIKGRLYCGKTGFKTSGA